MAVQFFYQRAEEKFLDSFGDLVIYYFFRILGKIHLLNILRAEASEGMVVPAVGWVVMGRNLGRTQSKDLF